MKFVPYLSVVLLAAATNLLYAAPTPAPKKTALSGQLRTNPSSPTTITADSLELDSKGRTFIYKNNVKVVRDDMTLTCEKLTGRYNEANEIETLVAQIKVEIIKGANIKANSERADYNAEKELLVLTENPRVIQGASEMNADRIKIFLETEETQAEGRVQMKLINADKPAK